MRRVSLLPVFTWLLAWGFVAATRQGLFLHSVLDPDLSEEVYAKAEDNLEIAKYANTEAKANTEEVLVSQQELLARQQLDGTVAAFDLARPSVPDTKRAEIEARVLERDTKVHKDGAVDASNLAKTISKDAAVLAGKAIVAQIEKDARDAAVKANKASKDWKAQRAKRVATSVAAAMQPYHLALLRAQKAAAQTHQKAMGAMEAAQGLVDKAEGMAGQAQTMQAAGLAIEAQQMMMMAHGAMSGAANLKAQAEKMYALANKINQSIGSYQLSEGMAAANAEATTLFNPPPPFPEA